MRLQGLDGPIRREPSLLTRAPAFGSRQRTDQTARFTADQLIEPPPSLREMTGSAVAAQDETARPPRPAAATAEPVISRRDGGGSISWSAVNERSDPCVGGNRTLALALIDWVRGAYARPAPGDAPICPETLFIMRLS